MRIPAMRCSFVVLAALAVMGASAKAQGPGGQSVAPAQPDFSKVEIKTTKISGNLYTLEGQGGTIGALAGPDGVLLVDDQYAPLTEKIVAAIRQISNGPIRFLINTHLHGDHTGGNQNFAKMGVGIFARDELRSRLAHPSPAANGTIPPAAPAAALPMVTYRGPVTFHMNGEEVEALPVPVAHTDGDTLVRFAVADVIMTGDFFRSAGYPNIDRTNGGTLKGMLEGLGFAIGLTGPNTKVVPGHGPITDRTGLTAYRDMIIAIRDRVARLIQQGKTAEEVIAARPTSDYDAHVVPNAMPTPERFLRQLYAELMGAR
ncbi:MAG: MBL fold metallo-hydrolase [Acidobacteria bacterium]|nr:MBL fold metallo-hydrolase [Acidobacteriota bacterium]